MHRGDESTWSTVVTIESQTLAVAIVKFFFFARSVAQVKTARATDFTRTIQTDKANRKEENVWLRAFITALAMSLMISSHAGWRQCTWYTWNNPSLRRRGALVLARFCSVIYVISANQRPRSFHQMRMRVFVLHKSPLLPAKAQLLPCWSRLLFAVSTLPRTSFGGDFFLFLLRKVTTILLQDVSLPSELPLRMRSWCEQAD